MSISESDVVLQEAINPTTAYLVSQKSVKKRCEVLISLRKRVSEEISDAEAKTMITVLYYALSTYDDKVSIIRLQELVRSWCKANPKQAGSVLVKVMTMLLPSIKLPVFTKNLSRHALTIFTTSATVMSELSDMFLTSDNALKTFISIQSTSFAGSVGTGYPVSYRRVKNIFLKSIKWDKATIQKYITLASSSSMTPWDFPFLAFLINTANSLDLPDVVNKILPKVLDKYVEVLFLAKTNIHVHLLHSSSRLLSIISHDQFTGKILPGIKRAALRTPEFAVNAFSEALSALNLDLSRYVKDFLEIFGPLLASTSNVVHTGAERCFVATFSEISESSAITDLVDGLFKILGGCHSKIVAYQQRIMVLLLLQKLASYSVSGQAASENIVNHAVEKYQTYMKSESNEACLIECIKSLSSWGQRLSSDILTPTTVNLFKTGFTKGNTAHIRINYLLAANCFYKNDSLVLLEDLEDTLISIVEKTSANTVLSVVEGYAAAALLLKLGAKDLGDIETVLPKIKENLLNKTILGMLISKGLTTIHENEAAAFIDFINLLISNFVDEINSEGTKILMSVLVEIILTKDYIGRKPALSVVRHLVQNNESLCDLVLKYLISVAEDHISTEESPHNSQKFVNIIKDIFKIISTLTKDTKEMALFNILLLIQNQKFKPENNMLFKWISDECSIDLYQFGETYKEKLLYLIQSTPTAECYNLISVISKHCLTLINPLFTICLDMFDRPAIREVSEEDLEIHRTPAGTLWKTTLLEEFEKSQVSDKNIKRESKLYSVDDQRWEEEMRAKLNKQKGMKLTKKQQDELNARLQTEAGIRQQIHDLKHEFKHKFNILMSILDIDLSHIMHSIARIASTTISILNLPLTAKKAIDLLVKLTLKVFPDSFKNLGHLLSRLTVRLHDPPCNINPEWLDEPLEKAFGRCIAYLKNMLSTGFTLSSASFSLAFPFLRYIIQETDMTSEDYEDNAVVALDVILAHLKKRATTDNIFDGPTFMPMEDLLEMCCKTFERKPVGIVGNKLLNVLKEVCLATNGDPGCAIAGEAELTILTKYLLSPNDTLRLNILKAFVVLQNPLAVVVTECSDVTSLPNKLSTIVWMSKFDVVANVKNAANVLWDQKKCNFRIYPAICNGLLFHVISEQEHLQIAASTALEAILEDLDECIDDILKRLMSLYTEKANVPKAVKDEMGRIIMAAPQDKFGERIGIANALIEIVPLLINDQILQLVNLIVPTGLSDHSVHVQGKMRDVGIKIIDTHGHLVVEVLLPVFENYLDNTPDSRATDATKQNVVILMASLARHLDQNDPKVKPIVCKLMESLSTPSEQVQVAVARCLVPLVPAIKDLAPQLIQRILYQLLESEKYGERRGAAFGLAGLVKGLGLLSLKQLEIMPTLIEAIQNKKNFKHREGSMMAFEQLSTLMGPLFEPYVISVIPHLLVCFGDGNQYVREATEKASKAIMAKLSGHGVKLVLPSLLKGLTDDSWRTKAGSVELLGAMAYCNPKQLSSCLPNIVPKLIEVMADSHTKVQKASHEALGQIGSVVKNPEIQSLTSYLLNALSEPSKHTDKCLAALIKTTFIHQIDAPSLALIVPVLTRSFEQRTDTKKTAAQIVGNILELTDEKDLKPYLNSIIPGLKTALLDPVPDVRLYAAKALGCLVKGIGEIPGLMDWLLEALVSEQSSVDRSGAAQGVSEVMIGLGVERLDKTMTEVLICLEDENLLPHIRDGYLMLFIYFPISMKDDFSAYVGSILTPILNGLASESEFVRDTSYKAGQRIVQQYADSAIMLFLPRLEDGLFNDNHRIRLASCQLLGDLLYRIMGVSGKQSTVSANEDDNFGTDETKRVIISVLGEERRNRVFSGLYMARSDVALAVRQASLHIWKIVVTNTPKTLKEILPVLIELILGCLASDVYDKRSVASRTLGDLVKKLGDRILPEVVPILEDALSSEDTVQRQGVCLGLSEIVSATSKEQVEVYSDSLLPAIRSALTDPSPDVRKSAASTFAALHNVLGHKALDEILSPLLAMMETLEGEKAEYLIGALKEIMAAKSRVVLPYMVPKLVSKPVNIGALASLSSVAGEALYEHLDIVITAAVEGLCELDEEDLVTDIEHAKSIISSISEDDGHENALNILCDMLKSEDVKVRRFSAILVDAFCLNEMVEMEEHIIPLWKSVLGKFSDPDDEVVKTCWGAFNKATKRLESPDQVRLVPDLKMAVNMAVDIKHKRDTSYTLRGFCLPKGLQCLVALYREGILNGSPELKEQAILGLKEAIQLTDQPALKPSVVQITGPLIRVLGERYTASIKIACLDTLSLLIKKVKVALKPFLSQLQTTFMKSLVDPARDVRNKGVLALTQLVSLHNRVDNLFTDIHSGTKHADLSIRETMFAALQGTMCVGGANMSNNLAISISVTLANHIGAPEDSIRTVNGACIGALATFLAEDELLSLIDKSILSSSPCDWTVKHGRAVAIAGMLKYAPTRIAKLDAIPGLYEALLKYMESDKVPVCNAGCYGAGQLIIHLMSSNEQQANLDKLVDSLARNCVHQSSNDVRSFASNMIHMINISGVEPMSDNHIRQLLVPLLENTTKKIQLIRSASEVAIATILRLKTTQDIYQRVMTSLDPKSLEIFNRFLPTAKRVALDYKTSITFENNIFSFLP